MSRSKRHHHCAQAYLKQFADEHGRVSVYDRITGEVRQQHISKVAVVNDLYAIEDEEGNLSDAYEQGLFQSIDNEIARILPRLLDERAPMTADDRENVNAFLVLQHGRTPYMRDTLTNIADLMLRLHLEETLVDPSTEDFDRFAEEFDPYATENERANIRRITTDLNQPLRLNVEHWIRSLVRILPGAAAALGTREWWLLDAEDGTFLTGDLPVVLDGLHALALIDAPAIYWPLSPRRVLKLAEPGTYNGRSFKRGLAKFDLVQEINQLTAACAARQIIWHPATVPRTGIRLPKGPHLDSVNGLTVKPGEYFYDKISSRSNDSGPAS